MKKLIKIIFSLLLFFFLFDTDLYSGLEGKINLQKPLLKVTVLDVWQGDSILVVFPNKKIMLVDGGLGGNKYSRFDAGKMVISPYLKRRKFSRIHNLVMTHPHSDHIGGLLAILKKFKIGQVMDSGMTYTTEIYLNCLTVIDKKKIKYIIPETGDQINLDRRVKVKVLHPAKDWEYSDNPNDNSIVLRIKYGKVSFLLTGDIEDRAEYNLLEEGVNLSSTILKVPHHGSATSSSDDFLDAVDPEVAVISVGRNNKFGHPSPSVLASYQDQDIKIYRTDYNGDITFITDGAHYKVETKKRKRK